MEAEPARNTRGLEVSLAESSMSRSPGAHGHEDGIWGSLALTPGLRALPMQRPLSWRAGLATPAQALVMPRHAHS